LGLLLLLAAALKAHQLATEPTAERDLFSHRWFLIVWVEVEIVLGLWFLSSFARRASWLAAVLCFLAFGAFTLHKALAGETSCGCFGRIEINPWHTFAFDLAALLALSIFRPDLGRSIPTSHARLRFATTAALALTAGIPAGLAAAWYMPARLSPDGQIAGDKRVVLLEPEQWVGARCPILKHVDIGDRLAKGTWTVVLYHHDCPHCQERVPKFEREVRERAARLGDARTAMVELAPYAPAGKSLLPPDTPCVRGRVSDARDWFVETPTLLVLVDGAVVDAREGDGPAGASPAKLAGLTPVAGETSVPLKEGGYDFGFVEPRSAHKVLLTVTNPSKKPLTITKVRSECKCMSAVASDAIIPPGESAPVRVVLVAPEKAVLYNKRILLQTDDPQAAPIAVPIKAAVGLPLIVEPPSVDFGTLAAGEEREKPIVIANRCAKPVRLIYSTSSGAGCFVRVPREPVSAMGKASVPLVVKAQASGRQTVSVQIQTDLDLQPSVNVSVQFTVGAPPRAPDRASADARGALDARKEAGP
jgi:hypothetical protein